MSLTNTTTILLERLFEVVDNPTVRSTTSAWRDSALGFFVEQPIMAALILLVFILAVVLFIKTWLDVSEGAFQIFVSNAAVVVMVAVIFFVFYILVDAGTITLQTFF